LFMQVILGLTQMPLIGMLVMISIPAWSAGVLEAFDVTGRGGRPVLNLLFKPLTSGSHTGRLFMMGVVVFAVGVVAISLMLSGSEELLDPDLIKRIEQGDIEAITQMDQDTLGKMVMAFMVGIGVSGTLSYFTIPLIWFGDRKLASALKEGILALVFHWKPFLLLALGLFLIGIPVAIVTGFLVTVAASGGPLALLTTAIIMVLMLAFQLLLFGTQYCAFRDVFGLTDRDQPLAPEDEDQLVA